MTMLKEELRKVKAEKDEMEKALEIEIKELRHENDILRLNGGILKFFFLISINTNISLC